MIKEAIKVIIADDHKMFTAGLKVALESSSLIHIEDMVSN